MTWKLNPQKSTDLEIQVLIFGAPGKSAAYTVRVIPNTPGVPATFTGNNQSLKDDRFRIAKGNEVSKTGAVQIEIWNLSTGPYTYAVIFWQSGEKVPVSDSNGDQFLSISGNGTDSYDHAYVFVQGV